MSKFIQSDPVTDGKPVEGVCAGRMVAYWPSEALIGAGLRPAGTMGYVPAVITADWMQRNPDTGEVAVVPPTIPCCNLRLLYDGCNVNMAKVAENPHRSITIDGCLGSVRFSLVPAYDCWTWIPKA